MKKLIQDIITKLNIPSITFADVRFTSTDDESIYFEKGNLRYKGASLDSKALGIRVLIDGCWGLQEQQI